jgi:hypothetical protein
MARHVVLLSRDTSLRFALKTLLRAPDRVSELESPKGWRSLNGTPIDAVVIDLPAGLRKTAVEMIGRRFDGPMVVLLDTEEDPGSAAARQRCSVLRRPFGMAELWSLVTSTVPDHQVAPEAPDTPEPVVPEPEVAAGPPVPDEPPAAPEPAVPAEPPVAAEPPPVAAGPPPAPQFSYPPQVAAEPPVVAEEPAAPEPAAVAEPTVEVEAPPSPEPAPVLDVEGAPTAELAWSEEEPPADEEASLEQAAPPEQLARPPEAALFQVAPVGEVTEPIPGTEADAKGSAADPQAAEASLAAATAHSPAAPADSDQLTHGAGAAVWAAVDEAPQAVAARLAQRLPADVVALLLDNGQGLLETAGGVGLSPDERHLQVEYGHNVLRELFRVGVGLIDDTERVHGVIDGLPFGQADTVTMVPLAYEGHGFGVLLAGRYRDRPGSSDTEFTELEIEALMDFAEDVAPALRSAVLLRRLKSQLNPAEGR